jgi:hypothetical protein
MCVEPIEPSPARSDRPAVETAAPYPRDLERTVALRDAAAVRIRPIRPDDEPKLALLYAH